MHCGSCGRPDWVTTRKVGRVVYYRLAPDLAEPLRDQCLRQLVVLSRASKDDGDGDVKASRPSRSAPAS
jgi:hypothetical protein